MVDGLPHAQLLPPAEPSPAGHAAAVAQGVGQGAPAQPLPQDENDAAQRGAVRNAGPTTPGFRGIVRLGGVAE